MNTYTPKTLQEAASLQNVTYIGGATDIMPLFKNEVRNDSELVLLKNIPELRQITELDDCIEIGSGVKLIELTENSTILSWCPAVAQAAGRTASPQIRNIATIGGNIMQDRRCIYFNQPILWRSALPLCFKTGGAVCHQIPLSPVCRAIYYSDVATALVALDAEVEYIEDGETKCSTVLELVHRHSECNGLACSKHLPVLVTKFRVPKVKEEKSSFYKYAMRTTIDFPLINFALRRSETRGTKLIAGAVAPYPVIMEETAKMIDSDASIDEIIACGEAELKKLAVPIKEACINAGIKRQLYAHFSVLLK